MKLTHSLLLATLSLGILGCSNTERPQAERPQEEMRRSPASEKLLKDRKFYLEPGLYPTEKCQRSRFPRTC